MMLFILTMSVYGVATLFSELIPKFHIGVIELSVHYFLFIPLTLAMLFDPLSVALGAATGEIIFSEIMLGQFGGLGEFKKFITLVIGIYIAGRMVKDPKNKKMVGIAAITGTAVQLILSAIVDILLVKLAVENFEAVPGLPASIVFTESFEVVNDLLFSGILFCLLPTLYMVPKLHGKIEPLMGMKPKDANSMQNVSVFTPKMIFLYLLGFLGAFLTKYIAESGYSIIDWEAEWAESTLSIIIGFVAATVVSVLVIFMFFKKAKQGEIKEDGR